MYHMIDKIHDIISKFQWKTIHNILLDNKVYMCQHHWVYNNLIHCQLVNKQYNLLIHYYNIIYIHQYMQYIDYLMFLHIILMGMFEHM